MDKIKLWPQRMDNIIVSKEKKKNWQENKVIAENIKKVSEELEGNGRVLVRASGTEALIRVMVEAKTQELVDKYVEFLSDIVRKELC